ncbi:exonuclease domain-containing protein [Lysobacter sp. A03]|uniref:exonuclease domain-containing protein n=1 Tax=Lysobacter sp. A03 TaxID=1199154 RepID=UPI000A02071E|nr:exonuclease domain-containing protein [Lysobacter sp. A03]
MQFAAIDVETANADLASICQIGVAFFRDGAHVDSWSTLVDPEDEFDGFNVSIHGIDERVVRGAPNWPGVAETLRHLLAGSVVACHTPFDRAATNLACRRHRLEHFDCQWLDTARVVRRAWPDRFGSKGYGLKNVAKFLGIEFRHHDALEDARAAGEILCRASAHTGFGLDDWFARIHRPIDPALDQPIARDGNSEGPLFGNVAVFTGSLALPRREAAELAARAGCSVGSSVTKKTTLLIVGDQDISKLGGKTKSSKHLKAEELIAQGCQIRILRESDFQSIVVAQAIRG